jgi:protein ImuB
LYACIHTREFPAQALLRLRTELRKQAFAVMDGEPPMQQVCSLNGKARMLGLEPGMTQVEVDTIPGVTVISRSRQEEVVTKTALLECAGCYSPRVQDCCKDGTFLCVIDIAGTEKLFGTPESLARDLHGRIRALNIEACVAVSANFHAAVTFAKGMSQHDPVQVIAPGKEGAALAPLPLATLDLNENEAETLASWGIRTLGMLASLPENELIARMGQRGNRLRQKARGAMPHLFCPVEPALSLEERIELDSPVEVLDALLFIVNLMLEQLIVRAASRALTLASVTVALVLEGGATHTRTVRPALPTNDRQLLLKLLHLELEGHSPQAAILSVGLRAEPGSAPKVQLGLFTPQLPDASRFDVTMARIRAIVGEENIGRAVLMDTHEQERFRMESFTIPLPRTFEVLSVPFRPALRRLRPPEAVFVRVQNAQPAAVIFRAEHYVVKHAYGPWETGGNWWSQSVWECERWDLVMRSQNRGMLVCCIVHDRLRDQWRMAGLYD